MKCASQVQIEVSTDGKGIFFFNSLHNHNNFDHSNEEKFSLNKIFHKYYEEITCKEERRLYKIIKSRPEVEYLSCIFIQVCSLTFLQQILLSVVHRRMTNCLNYMWGLDNPLRVSTGCWTLYTRIVLLCSISRSLPTLEVRHFPAEVI